MANEIVRIATPFAVRAWEHQFRVYRRVWKSNVAGSIVRPVLFLLGMGLGVGGLVDTGKQSEQLLEGLSYFEFFGSGLVATTTMIVLANDSLWPIMGGFKWQSTFVAQAGTPLTPRSVLGGLVLWHAFKGVMAAAGVAVTLTLFASTRSWGLIPAVFFAAVGGLAHSMPLIAWSSSRHSELMFPQVFRILIVPMFLFAGAFYPIDQLPGAFQWVARATPIYHSVELCRGSIVSTLGVGQALMQLGYLMVWIVGGSFVSARVFASRLGK